MGSGAEVTEDGWTARTLGKLLSPEEDAGAREVGMSMGERGRRWLAALGLTVLLVQAGSFWMLWGGGEDYWAGGDMKFGDLAQHYGAGLLWQENRAEDLYREGRLGEWLDGFKRTGKPGEPAAGTKGFNYVYPPLVAWVAAGVGGKGGYAWFATAWFVVSLVIWAAALIGLRGLIGWHWKDGVAWLWAATFPAAYYGLVLGQNHALTLLVVVGTGWLLQLKREVAAGLVLSCLFYKPQWGVYLAVMMVLWGHWRLGIGWALGTMGWVILMFSVCGSDLVAAWARVLPGMETGAQNQVDNLNQTWRAFISTLEPGLPSGATLGLAGLIWAGATAWLGWKRRGVPPGERSLRDLWEASALGVFAMPYVMHYDAIMFVPLWLSAALAPGRNRVRWAVVGTVLAGWVSINLWETPLAWMAPVWSIMFAGLLQTTRQPEIRP